LSFLISSSSWAQQNRIKLGFIGFPSASGFGTGTLGYERLDKTLNKSWQISANGSGGAIATDAGTETRKWITVERTFYRSTMAKKITWSYSFFSEAGTRQKNAGYIHPTPEKTFQYTKQFEVSPGTSLGIQLQLGKRWRLESVAGTKIVFAKGNDYYYNSISKQTFTEAANETKLGYRLMGMISYQFSYNVR
jgi:hypothetical protein